MSFDVARVRGLYPNLGAGIAHLDGNFSTLLPETVIRAIIPTLRSSPSQPGSRSTRSQRAAATVDNARRAIGAIVRWAEVDVETGELPEWQYDRLISRRTRLVTVPLANLATGAIPDARRISGLAHAVGALAVVDAGAALPHMPLDMAELGADLLGVSVSAFGGPTVGAMVARDGLLYELDEDSTAPVPQRYELGPLPVELLDGVVAAVDHLSSLDEWASGTRRQRLVSSLTATGEYERQLFAVLDRRLR